MTDATTKQAHEQRLSDLVERADERRETALRRLTAWCRAWRATAGLQGPELTRRIEAASRAAVDLRGAGNDWMDAEAALAQAQAEED